MKSPIVKYAEEHGLKIVEATKPAILTVNKKDVQRATTQDPSNCAFAQSCKRTLHVDHAFFFKHTAYIQRGRSLVRYRIPPSITTEIVAFDRSGSMEPGNYTIKPHAPCNTRENVRKRVKNLRKSHHINEGTTNRRIDVHYTTNVRSKQLPA